MNDETIAEILSRHLDGDLDEDEKRKLQARLEAEPDLADALAAMRRIRNSVSSLASAERVPPELDSLVDPLLRGRPEPVALRPWARWLATAAVVILGVTVVIEVNRRNPGPSTESMARLRKEGISAEPTERFALAPLPTSSLPLEQQPLGASDRLLASPVAEVELDEPAPLEVLGPLDEGEVFSFETTAGADAPLDDAEGKSSAVEKDKAGKKSEGFRQPEPPSSGDLDLSGRSEDLSTARATSRAAAPQSWKAAPRTGRGQLFVFIGEESAWREFSPSATCKAGRYPVRVVIAGGVVREARPVGGAASASPSQRLCAAGLILDLEIDGVADGEFPAEIVVEPRGSGE
jgi:hypothetical protein